ncbi:MAG: signal peptidase I [Actinomycetota bacterium]
MKTDEREEAEEEPGRQEGDEKKEGLVEFLKELPILIVVAFAIALLIKTFLFQAFFIPSGSMENTLLVGDRVLVSKLSYRFGEPRRGDILVFRGPESFTPPAQDRGPIGNFLHSVAVGLGLRSSEQDFIKRVIAVEGDEVEVKDGSVFVNGNRLRERYLHDRAPLACSGQFCGPLEVPDNEVFVMGDNRANSRDSRVFGPIDESDIVGKAFVLIWPPDRFESL